MNKIKVEIFAPVAKEFLGIYLTFTDIEGVTRQVQMRVGFRDLYQFLKNDNSVYIDFYLVATIVYGIDCLLKRYYYSYDGWSREISVEIPVFEKDLWNGKKDDINELLTFLTGDYWDVSFKHLGQIKVYQKGKREKKKRRFDQKNYASVSLFSGGLDSLSGVVDAISSSAKKQKILLASHYDSNSGGPNKDQVSLFNELVNIYPDKIDWVQTQVSIYRKDLKGTYIDAENSYRSRSLLFISIAVLLLSECESSNELLIPENGSISLNHPLTKSRSSSLSTRTTHPYYLNKLQGILDELGMDVKIKNPFEFKTKGEVIDGCKDLENLKKLYLKSVSCGKRGHRFYWDNPTGTDHCGVCMPCIYRRAGLHKAKMDKQLYGSDILKKAKDPNDFQDLTALLEFLNANYSKQEIETNLLINGSLSLDNLSNYADVVIRTIDEVKVWINDKGNADLKNLI
jgi:7-cyano-7-deazaguanine synthase in queuosine biosynthesis|tara:strand:- start:38043 stop:39407 length:1365 start_codon:yes stop_codon:yes gene_type:complete